MTEPTLASLEQYPHRMPQFPKFCDNCGRYELLEYFHYVLDGIFLCENCGDLPISAVVKCRRKKIRYDNA